MAKFAFLVFVPRLLLFGLSTTQGAGGDGWLVRGVAAKGPQLKFLPSVLAIFNMQAATQFAIAVSARFSAIIILNDK